MLIMLNNYILEGNMQLIEWLFLPVSLSSYHLRKTLRLGLGHATEAGSALPQEGAPPTQTEGAGACEADTTSLGLSGFDCKSQMLDATAGFLRSKQTGKKCLFPLENTVYFSDIYK